MLSTGKCCAHWEIMCYFQGNTVFTELSTGKYCFNWEILCLLGNTVFIELSTGK